MTQPLWSAVEHYLTSHLLPADAALDAALVDSQAAGLPAIHVTPNLGKFLQLLAMLTRARHILEIGTLGGFSTIWLARGLAPGGRLITLESNPNHAEVARTNIARAGLAGVVELRLGRALDTLPQIAAENRGPFDLVFIDADKPNNLPYFEWALRLTRPGSLVVVDNVVRKGAILDQASDDANVQGTRRLFDHLATNDRVTATALQTVSSKGHDGLILALVNE